MHGTSLLSTPGQFGLVLLPDISKLPNFDLRMFSEEYIYGYFEFDSNEIEIIRGAKLWK